MNVEFVVVAASGRGVCVAVDADVGGASGVDFLRAVVDERGGVGFSDVTEVAVVDLKSVKATEEERTRSSQWMICEVGRLS